MLTGQHCMLRHYFPREICNSLYLHNFVQVVDCPTHQSGSILDLVLTNVQHRVLSASVYSGLPLISDHFPILANICSYSTNVPSVDSKHSLSLKLNYCKANFSALADHLTDLLVIYEQFSFDSLKKSWLAIKNAVTLSTLLNVPRYFPSSARFGLMLL